MPARFIEIYPYIQWILENQPTTRRTGNIPAVNKLRATTKKLTTDALQDSVRRLEQLHGGNFSQANQKKGLRYQTYDKTYIAQEKYEDKDTVLLKYATNESLTLYRGKEI